MHPSVMPHALFPDCKSKQCFFLFSSVEAFKIATRSHHVQGSYAAPRLGTVTGATLQNTMLFLITYDMQILSDHI
jgi:hypothetical protein